MDYRASLSFTIPQTLFKLMSIESVMLSKHLLLCRPLLLLSSVFPSIKVFFSELPLHIRWPKYWSFSCSVSPSSEYSGLLSFRIDWFDLLAVQGALKSLLQHQNSKASIRQCSVFFMVQLTSICVIFLWLLLSFFFVFSFRLSSFVMCSGMDLFGDILFRFWSVS